jgi:nickel transport protein
MNRTVFVLALLLAAAGAHGHDLWLEKCEGGYVLLNGHVGSGDSARETIAYQFSDIISVCCFDSEGNESEAEIERGFPARIAGSCAVVYAVMSSGYWSETPFETKNLPKDEAWDPIRTWISYESVKRIDGWSEGISSPRIDGLEIIPVKDPLVLEKGRKVRLLVTFKGKPAVGVPVAYFDSTRGATDSRGRINIRLGHGGMQLIKASLTLPGDSIKTDEVIYNTSLVFDIEEE